MTWRFGAVCLCTGILTLTGCANAVGPGHDASPSVLAEVGANTITVADVREHLTTGDGGPAVLTENSPPPDLWRRALDDAVRDALLSMEARRLGLSATLPVQADARPGLARALIDRERARVAGLSETSISDAAARTWFTGHTARFQTLKSAHAAWARLRDRTKAMTLLDHSKSQTEEQFLQAARREGAMAVGTAALDRAGRGADVLVARAAFALGRQGATGLVEGEDGSWWLVRLGRVELVSPRWDQQMVSRAKAVMAWDREQAHLRQLAQRLETRWKVVVHEDRLEAARPASPDGE